MLQQIPAPKLQFHQWHSLATVLAPLSFRVGLNQVSGNFDDGLTAT
jgi:hypothetical protein